MMIRGSTVYLICCGSEQVTPREVKITDGRHGDGVVGVIVLHTLRCAGYQIFQIIFSVRWEMGSSEDKKKQTVSTDSQV